MPSSVPHNLREWIKLMGFTQEGGSPGLTEQQLQDLTPVNMRPYWRHLMKYVRPKQEVANIRKVLLLNRLKTGEKLDSKINMALTSPSDLEKYLEMNRVEKEIKTIEQDTHDLRETIEPIMTSNKSKKYKIEHKKNKINEATIRSEICMIYVKSIENKIEELVEASDVINELKTIVLESSFKEFNDNKANVLACISPIKDYIELRRSEKLTKEEVTIKYQILSDFLMEQTCLIPTKTKFSSLIDSIKSSNHSMKIMAAQNPRENPEDIKLLSKDFKSIEGHFLDLWKRHYDLSVQMVGLKDQLSTKAKEYDQCKKELSMNIQNALNIPYDDDVSINCILEFVGSSLTMISLKEMLTVLKENVSKTLAEIKSVHIETFELDMLYSKFNTVNDDYFKKCNMVVKCKNSLALQNDLLRETIKSIQDKVAETSMHFNTMYDNKIETLQENEDNVFHLFMENPLELMNRSWDSDLQLDYNSKQNVLNTALSNILLRPDQNPLCYALELLIWAETLKKTDHSNLIEAFEYKTHIPIINFNNDISKASDEVEKSESEVKQLMSVIRFWKDQPFAHYVPEDLEILGERYSVWRDRQSKKFYEANNDK